jgi:hypothetical protein
LSARAGVLALGVMLGTCSRALEGALTARPHDVGTPLAAVERHEKESLDPRTPRPKGLITRHFLEWTKLGYAQTMR